MKLQELFINRDMQIKDALKRLDETAKKILIVVENNKLVGVITDGDIRRWILKNGDFKESVDIIMAKNPKYIYKEDAKIAKKILKKYSIEAIPVVNENHEVMDIIFWNDNFNKKLNHTKLNNPVVIMAGGAGTRLKPYTNVLPKPLIPIGDIPIVERIINRFAEYGCDNFYMTVNHKKNMIKAYFNEIEKNYTLNYIDEEKPLGTAGSLFFLKDEIKDTFFLSNCDILIEGNYSDMLRYHKEHKAKITLITSIKHYTIPYGVIQINGDSNVKKMEEKPEYDFLVNTGMYILEPEVINDIPEGRYFHITELINTYIDKGDKIGIYPISEGSWLDMGQFKEMEIMLERLGIN